MKKPVYDFKAAQGFTTDDGRNMKHIADALKTAALYLVNANWDRTNREELIYDMQVAVTDVLDFLSCITVREVEQ